MNARERRLGEPLEPDMVRINMMVRPKGDFGRALKINGEQLQVSLEMYRCPICEALLLPEDRDGHMGWHGRLNTSRKGDTVNQCQGIPDHDINNHQSCPDFPFPASYRDLKLTDLVGVILANDRRYKRAVMAGAVYTADMTARGCALWAELRHRAEAVQVRYGGQDNHEEATVAGSGNVITVKVKVDMATLDARLTVIEETTERIGADMANVTEALQQISDAVSSLEEDVQRVLTALENEELSPEAQQAVDSLQARFDTLNTQLDEAVPPTAPLPQEDQPL